jgi:hypothetical protein
MRTSPNTALHRTGSAALCLSVSVVSPGDTGRLCFLAAQSRFATIQH